MARTSAKKKRQEQLEVPGTERKRIPAIDDIGAKLRECRTERMSLQIEEAELQEEMLAAMDEHGVTSYKFSVDDEELTATAGAKRKVKISKSTATLSAATED